jgi:AmiR/NasT family two-component response regulator
VDQLRRAIASRPVIDQARGVLMALHACTSDEAWHILREASQLSNTKLRTVAAAVTAGAESDGPPPPPEVRAALRAALARLRR